jgi:hypothetical protein
MGNRDLQQRERDGAANQPLGSPLIESLCGRPLTTGKARGGRSAIVGHLLPISQEGGPTLC